MDIGVEITEAWTLPIAGGVVLLALLGLAVLTDRQPRTQPPDPVRLLAAAAELAAYAVATRAEAGRAEVAAEQARTELAAAEQVRDAAWAEQEAAEQDFERLWQAAQAGREAAARASRADLEASAERDRTVSRAALSAYRRGDISLLELREVFRRTGDWDPGQEERERALEHSRMRQMMARRAYDRAAALARRAEHEVWAAEATVQELLDEATRSAAEAQEGYFAAQEQTRRRRRSGRGSTR